MLCSSETFHDLALRPVVFSPDDGLYPLFMGVIPFGESTGIPFLKFFTDFVNSCEFGWTRILYQSLINVAWRDVKLWETVGDAILGPLRTIKILFGYFLVMYFAMEDLRVILSNHLTVPELNLFQMSLGEWSKLAYFGEQCLIFLGTMGISFAYFNHRIKLSI